MSTCASIWVVSVALIAAVVGWSLSVTPIPDASVVELRPLPQVPKNNALAPGQHLYTGSLVGAESLVLDPVSGRVVTGLADGRIVRLEPDGTVTTLARTGKDVDGCGTTKLERVCGRPLGIRSHPTESGAFYVIDAYKGLLVLHSDGSLETLFSRADDANLMLGNDLVVDPADGSVYFTNTHNMFERRTIGYAYLENSPRGSVWRYDPASGATTVFKSNVVGPNGIDLGHEGHSIIVCSGPRAQLLRIWLRDHDGHAAGSMDTLNGNLPLLPDNIREASNGNYWLGGSSKRMAPFSLTDALGPYPIVRRLLTGLLPHDTIYKLIPAYGIIAEIDSSTGDVVQLLQDPTGFHAWLSEALELTPEQAVTALGADAVRTACPASADTGCAQFLLLGSFRNDHVVLLGREA